MSTALDEAEVQRLVAAEVARQLSAYREETEHRLAALRERTVDDAATIVVFSGDLDKVFSALVIATGAAAAGLETSMFFTFWGLAALKKKAAAGAPRKPIQKLVGMLTGSGTGSLGLSKLNYFGIGARLLRKMMKDEQIATVEELMAVAREQNVKLIACTMSMDAMGIAREDLVDGLTYGGVASYLADAVRSRVTLFI